MMDHDFSVPTTQKSDGPNLIEELDLRLRDDKREKVHGVIHSRVLIHDPEGIH